MYSIEIQNKAELKERLDQIHIEQFDGESPIAEYVRDFKISPCPHCGETDYLDITFFGKDAQIHCELCAMFGPEESDKKYEDEEEAIRHAVKVWNTRPKIVRTFGPIKGCPFCGSLVEIQGQLVRDNEGKAAYIGNVGCNECNASGPSLSCIQEEWDDLDLIWGSEADAIEAVLELWNQRN